MTPYLEKRSLYPALIATPPAEGLGIVIVIPCFDEPDLLTSLAALAACNAPRCRVEVIVVINASEKSSPERKAQNEKTRIAATDWIEKQRQDFLRFHLLSFPHLPPKKAGVGLARKIGMDEAVRRLHQASNERGVIVGFDADSLCQENYLQAIEQFFQAQEKVQAASIHYEHPLEGTAFNSAVYQAIAAYELHLRYFTLAKRFAGYPHAFETIGSSMAVRMDAYQQQGGMNTRKAGEDFYFLNKFMLINGLRELNTTTVIPSPRLSHRVPFGTGKAVSEALEMEAERTTYAPQTFLDLKVLFQKVTAFYTCSSEELKLLIQDFSPAIATFLEANQFTTRLREMRQNTTSLARFQKRFFRWFDPFLVMKFAHHARDHYYAEVPVRVAAQWLLLNFLEEEPIAEDTFTLLRRLRKEWTSLES